MWGRFEACDRIRIAILPMAIFFFSISMVPVAGQVLPEQVVRLLEGEAERGRGDLDELVSYCEMLMESPVNINTASEKELMAFPLLTPFQVASILEYRQMYGAVLSKGELAQIDGFNEQKVDAISPFISLDYGERGWLPEGRRLSHKVILRGNAKYGKHSQLGYYGKYLFKMEENLQVGATVSPNGVSAHLGVGQIDLGRGVRLENGIVGTYSVRLGQGLLAWNSFSISGAGAPSSLLKRGNGLVPYTATDPEGAFLGVGAKVSFGDMVESVLFYSQKEETVTGGSVSLNGEKWRAGVNLLAVREVAWEGGVSADLLWTYGRYRFFGECAVDWDGDGAVLIGALLPVSGDFECGTAIRCYSPEYYASFSGGLSSSSGCKNQIGGTYSFLWNISRFIELRSSVDAVFYPAPRYGVKIPSMEVESAVEGEWEYHDHSIICRYRYHYYSHQRRHQHGIRVDYRFRPSSGIYVGARGEVVWNNKYRGELTPGVAFYVECGYLPLKKKWEVALRGTVYHIDSWDNRIYFYERDLPQSFSVPALYRRGWDLYGYIKYAPLSRVGLYLKASVKMIKGQITLTF